MSSPDPLEVLTRSEKYSNLVLECEGIKFNVHKVMVCTRSLVLAAACDGNVKVRKASDALRI